MMTGLEKRENERKRQVAMEIAKERDDKIQIRVLVRITERRR